MWANFGKWSGQCAECGAWNSLIEAPTLSMHYHKPQNRQNPTIRWQSAVIPLNAIPMSLDTRLPTGVGEFDRLGGGLVAGSVVLIGGDLDIGKSTILLPSTWQVTIIWQVVPYMLQVRVAIASCYACHPLRIAKRSPKVLAGDNVSHLASAYQEQPAVAVIDSIQTLFTERRYNPLPGGVSQIRVGSNFDTLCQADRYRPIFGRARDQRGALAVSRP